MLTDSVDTGRAQGYPPTLKHRVWTSSGGRTNQCTRLRKPTHLRSVRFPGPPLDVGRLPLLRPVEILGEEPYHYPQGVCELW